MANLLGEILECHGLGRKSLRHCKSLMGTIFSHAKNAGVLDGANPIRDSRIPRAAKASAPTYAYTPAETIAMLDALTGTAKRAIALMFFTGLRPGEARAAKWTDLDRDVKVLRVHSSMWRTTTTSTKTLASEGVVPICSALREILEESKRESEYILTSPARQARRFAQPGVSRNRSAITALCQMRQREKRPRRASRSRLSTVARVARMVCAASRLRNVGHNTRLRDRCERNAAAHGPQHHSETLHQRRSGRDSSRRGTNGCAVSTKQFGPELRQRKMQKQLFTPILNDTKDILCNSLHGT